MLFRSINDILKINCCVIFFMSNISIAVAVTGANSFVGKSLRKFLHKNKVNVLGISRKNFGKHSTETKVQSKNLQEQQLQKKLKNYDVLVHLIGIGREVPKSTFEEINVNLTKNAIRTCKNAGIKKIIYISGLGVSKNSTSSYFASKYRAEREIINSGLDYTIFRASYIIGKTDHLTKSLSKQVKKGTIIIPGSGRYRLQPIFVEDVAKIILEAILEKKFSNKILDLVGPQKISFEDFVKLFSKNMKVKFKKLNLDDAYEESTYSSESLDILIGDHISNVNHLQKLTNVKLTAVEKFLQTSSLS